MKRNTSQGSVATYARCGGITNGHFTAANLLENLPVKEFGKSVNILQNYGHEFRVQFFWPTLYMHKIVHTASLKFGS